MLDSSAAYRWRIGMTSSRVLVIDAIAEAKYSLYCFMPMRSAILAIIIGILALATGLSAIATTRPTIDLGEISKQPTAVEFPFESFFHTRRLSQIEFAPDNRMLFFLRDDGDVNNVFALDIDTRKMRQVTNFGESVDELFIDPEGRYLISLTGILRHKPARHPT